MTESGKLICKYQSQQTSVMARVSYRVYWRSTPSDVMSGRLLAHPAVELPQQDEGEDDEDEEDDGDGDADQDGRVVRLGADGLGPGGLAELVFAGEGPDLKIIISELTIHYSLILLRPAQPRICESRKYCVARTSNLIPRKLIFEPRHKNLVGKSLP